MPITPPNLPSLSKVIANAMSKDFLTLARRLREVQDIAPDIFFEVIEVAGVGRRKAYALIQIDNSFRKLSFDRDRLLGIGWTKAVLVAPHIGQQNCEELLGLAEDHTAHDLAVVLTGGVAHPGQRVVLLYFLIEEYELFERMALAHGAIREGRGLAGKEQAVVSILSVSSGSS
jgi:hypothetical protein